MSLTKEDIVMIAEALKPVIAEPLKDVATSHQLAVQLVKDVMAQLKECRLEVDASRLERTRLEHRLIDADTSIGIYRDLSEIYKKRAADLEIALEEKQAEINNLRQGLTGNEQTR